ncbi:unnamed protein product [Urochloa humidicola]
MVYEAAAAVALRDQSQPRSREDKGRGRGQVEEKAAVRCGVLRILRRVFYLSVAPAPSEKE